MNSSKSAFPYKTLQVSAGGGPVTRARALIFNPEGKILLSRIPGSDYWSLPGGKVDPLESTEQAVKRELIEELELVPTNIWLRYIVEIPFINSMEFYYVGETDRLTTEGMEKGVESGELAEIGFFTWGEKTFKPEEIAKIDVLELRKKQAEYFGVLDR